MSDNTNIWSNAYNPFQSFKVLAWYERIKSIKTGKFQAPVNIALDLISGTQQKKSCGGFACGPCMSNLEDHGKLGKIPTEILFVMPEFFNAWGVRSLCLAGHNSDPCAYNHKDLIHFLRLCKQWNIEIGFVSNGALYSDLLLEEVARNCKWSGWSINAGNAHDHEIFTNSKPGTFDKIMDNMKRMSEIIKEKNIQHDIGYKYLITDDNYDHIYQAALWAKANGARHLQIRPCELPAEKAELINVNVVEDQIRQCLTLEVPGVFEVFGIREKFTPDFKKQPPKRCIASPLGSTWMGTGDIVICPDRRWSAHLPNMVLGNFITEGLEAIRRKWGGPEHRAMIAEANAHLGDCIRCTSLKWHHLYENTVENDTMDVTLI